MIACDVVTVYLSCKLHVVPIGLGLAHAAEMPLKGSDHSENAIDEDRYFTSLSELDAWADKSQKKLLGVLPYTRRSKAAARLQQGKLLVCHDYKVSSILQSNVSAQLTKWAQGRIHRETLGTFLYI